jgi:hypothetical protein
MFSMVRDEVSHPYKTSGKIIFCVLFLSSAFWKVVEIPVFDIESINNYLLLVFETLKII